MHSVETVSNNKIKEIVKLHQKKYRDETGLFIAEGEKVLEEMITADVNIREIFVIEGFNAGNINKKCTVISESVMKKLSTTESVCPVLVVAEKKKFNTEAFSDYKHVILLDSISDPGNLGTIIRSAAAFGFDGIVLYGNCVDLYSSKVIRSSAGNFFKVPIIGIKNTEKLKKTFKNHIFIASALGEKNNITFKECSQIKQFVIMMGSEAKGLCSDLVNIADKNIRLDMMNNVESLNLAVSASVILYGIFSSQDSK